MDKFFTDAELEKYEVKELMWFFEGVIASRQMDDIIAARRQEELYSN